MVCNDLRYRWLCQNLHCPTAHLLMGNLSQTYRWLMQLGITLTAVYHISI